MQDKHDHRSPPGIAPAKQTDVAGKTNPQRSSERPRQTAEVPLGTGTHAEPPGGGGRQSQRVAVDKKQADKKSRP